MKTMSTLAFIRAEMEKRGLETLHSTTSTAARSYYNNTIDWNDFRNPDGYEYRSNVNKIHELLGIFQGNGEWYTSALEHNHRNGESCDAETEAEIEIWRAFVQEMLDDIDWSSDEFWYYPDGDEGDE